MKHSTASFGRPTAVALLGSLICIWPTRAEAQVTLKAAYTIDAFRNLAGGVAEGGDLLHNFDLTAGINGDSIPAVQGLEAFVYILANAGGSVGRLAGDRQGASNIEAPTALRLYEAWIQKNWGDEFALLVGLYDLNSEFYSAETGSLFINSAHGIGPEFAASGKNGPSIFPVTSLTARLRWKPTKTTYALAGILDAVPGDTARSRVVHIDLGDGALAIGEVGLQRDAAATTMRRKLAVGAWAYSSDFSDATTAELTRQGTYGVYFLGDTELYREPRGPGQGLSAYGRVGYADHTVHPVQWSWGAGFAYAGLVRGRDDDQAGVAIAAVNHSARYLRAQADVGTMLHAREIALEGTYSAALGSRVRVQPNIQYIINPGMSRELSNALLLAARVEVSL